jgi:saccharopine dehydrogenase-like NADP-dependent oxidoreductase
LKESDITLKKFNWMGFFTEKMPITTGTAMDVLTEIMLNKMSFAPGERDMIILHHEFEAEYPNGRKAITSSLVEYGIPRGDSAMARTVTLPAAIGVKMILEGSLQLTGVHIPLLPRIYLPVLEELEKLGVSVREEYGDLT